MGFYILDDAHNPIGCNHAHSLANTVNRAEIDGQIIFIARNRIAHHFGSLISKQLLNVFVVGSIGANG